MALVVFFVISGSAFAARQVAKGRKQQKLTFAQKEQNGSLKTTSDKLSRVNIKLKKVNDRITEHNNSSLLVAASPTRTLTPEKLQLKKAKQAKLQKRKQELEDQVKAGYGALKEDPEQYKKRKSAEYNQRIKDIKAKWFWQRNPREKAMLGDHSSYSKMNDTQTNYKRKAVAALFAGAGIATVVGLVAPSSPGSREPGRPDSDSDDDKN